MEVEVNSVVLAARIYSAVREKFFICNGAGDQADADGGDVIATIRGAILTYVDEAIHAKLG
jgi:hypothetical protein